MRRIIFLSMSAFLMACIFANSTLFVSANSTPQTLPFTQDWSNTGLITTNDDWTMVPGIVGFLGDNPATTQAAIDPRTILNDFATQDVIANQSTPNTQTSGGVAEFEITNPTIALQGSGTADAPNIVLYLNTTGQSNIRVAFNARDIDGSADNAVQPIAVQYRVGGTGDYSNVPGSYFPDVTTGPNEATAVTPVAVTLPPAANNKSLVEVRILTTNAPGSDEWVGIDDINVTASTVPNTVRTESDFNGDGRTDYAVLRAGAVPNNSSILTWYVQPSNGATGSTVPWGLAGDIIVPADYDGDGRTDMAVYRPAEAPNSYFYVMQSSTNTMLAMELGRTGDDPTVVGDYDGDGRADMAVFRANAVGSQGFFYYRPSTSPSGIVFRQWGSGNVKAVPGDYDGDGRFDFCIRRDSGSGQAQFVVLRSSTGTETYVNWGLVSDTIAPGDYDGDLRWDFTVIRSNGTNLVWYTLEADGESSAITFGLPADFPVPGDYDGDTKTDVAVWRSSSMAGQSAFFVRQSSNGIIGGLQFGQQGDYPAANFRVR